MKSPAPLSLHQLSALVSMARRPLQYSVAGFFNALQPSIYWNSQTIMSIEKRGLCSIVHSGKKRIARISRKGRRQAEGQRE